MYDKGMSRALRWTFTIAPALCWGLIVIMALLEVVHVAHGQSGSSHLTGVS
jgi:hypothetical protein